MELVVPWQTPSPTQHPGWHRGKINVLAALTNLFLARRRLLTTA